VLALAEALAWMLIAAGRGVMPWLKRIQVRLVYDQRLSLFWSVLHLGHAC
jgi:hypothetical protein